MRKQNIVPLLFAAIGFASTSSFAAIGSEREESLVREASAIEVTDEEHSVAADEAAGFREAGEKVCREAVNAAASFGQQFSALSQEMPRLMSQLGEQIARDVAPTMQKLGEEMAPVMRQFAERLREAAKEFERSNRDGSANNHP